ncbi:hypothetical protein H8D04_00735 [bacterium]|nr:hypothetical protein [bacterium]
MKCRICEKKYDKLQFLACHVAVTHKSIISKRDYTVKYLYEGKIPLCKCGCGNETSYRYFGKFMTYISGHNTRTENPFMKLSKSERHKIGIKSSKTRIRNWAKSSGNPRKIYNDILLNCKWCNKVIETTEQYSNQKCCSYECFNLYKKESIKNKTNDGVKYLTQLLNARQLSGYNNTKPEKMVKKILKNEKVKYVSQYNIILNDGSFIFVDFYLPDTNVVLEVDGDYWHCNPIIYDENYVHEASGKTANEIWKEDNVRTKRIKSLGYNVKRIWESDISKENVVDLLNNRYRFH